MNASTSDAKFTGSIADTYESLLVPMFFAPYADDLAPRVAALKPSRVLEIAAGTGVATRAMARALPAGVQIIATDLNQPMIDRAAATGVEGNVEWQQADAMQLPFDDASFDVVVCQFGVMFFPIKAVALAQARRVLRPGGTLLFNVWDSIEENDFANIVTSTLVDLFPNDPPLFLARTPHGYFDWNVISNDIANAGFNTVPRFETITARSMAVSAKVAAMATCTGTPLRNEIEARAPAGLLDATNACADALAQRFGDGVIDGKIQAHIVSVVR